MNPIMKWADNFLLVGVPAIGAVVMAVATATPGNPPIGLAIGWAAVVTWGILGTLAMVKRDRMMKR